MRKLFRRFEGTVSVDGKRSTGRLRRVAAGTVREVGLGFKLVHRADEDTERFGMLAIHSRPWPCAPDFPAVHAGRGVAPSGPSAPSPRPWT